MFKVNDKTPKRRHWHRFGAFIVNFEHISHLCFSVFIGNFEQENTGWDGYTKYHRDRNKDGGRIIFKINENIPCKAVNLEEIPDDCEII